jgi:hypothetical protein
MITQGVFLTLTGGCKHLQSGNASIIAAVTVFMAAVLCAQPAGVASVFRDE